MEQHSRRNDTLIPLSVLVGTVAIFMGLLQVSDRMIGLERRITGLEVRTDILLRQLEKPR